MAWPAQNFGGPKFGILRRVTVSCLGYRLLKHKMTRYAKNCGCMAPSAPMTTPMLQVVNALPRSALWYTK